jgi:hypothetical protein
MNYIYFLVCKTFLDMSAGTCVDGFTKNHHHTGERNGLVQSWWSEPDEYTVGNSRYFSLFSNICMDQYVVLMYMRMYWLLPSSATEMFKALRHHVLKALTLPEKCPLLTAQTHVNWEMCRRNHTLCPGLDFSPSLRRYEAPQPGHWREQLLVHANPSTTSFSCCVPMLIINIFSYDQQPKAPHEGLVFSSKFWRSMWLRSSVL